MAEVQELIRMMKEQQEQHQRQVDQLMALLKQGSAGSAATLAAAPVAAAIPSFAPFDPSAELWTDYYARFCTFLGANSIPDPRKAQVFLTNQSATTYKLLANLAAQQTPPTDINNLTLDAIVTFMKDQFDPKRFVVRERFRFWSDMQRKPGETIQELAARIRQDAATCDFPSIKDPQDEALRTRFICSVGNEAVLKALFKVKDDELTFTEAIKIAIEVEDAAKVAKETVYGNRSNSKPVNKVKQRQPRSEGSAPKASKSGKPPMTCYRCGSPDHKANDCRFKDAACHYCSNKGHLESVCRKKLAATKGSKSVRRIEVVKSLQAKSEPVPKLEVNIDIDGKTCVMELDTATSANFITKHCWQKLGCPTLDEPTSRYESASKHDVPVLGTFVGNVSLPDSSDKHDAEFIVADVPDLNLLGRTTTRDLGISVDEVLQSTVSCNAVFDHIKEDTRLRNACRLLCEEFPELWKPELGCLKDVELEVRFSRNYKPVFYKARPVPMAIQEDLEKAYQEGIAKGVWEPVQFNDCGTPVVPIKKPAQPGQKAKLRVCGDYSVSVNRFLPAHRHPLPLPEDLMRKLRGGYGFTKIDLADAYNQIRLGPRSQRRLALSTHTGVLLQKRLPFGIKSAPGYFQQIMDQLTQDLPGVAVYIDDILVSGKDADDHLQNLRRLLQRLSEKGLRGRLEKCSFARPWVEYLGHILSQEGIAKGHKVDDVLKMPPPSDVSSLRSFLGSVQFYAKFLPPNFSSICEPLYRLTKKGTPWKWDTDEQGAFQTLRNLLASDSVLVHFDEKVPIGIACDASNVGIGAVLFHRFPDRSERPIANASKTLSESQRNYSQIQKEALAIIFGLKKFYQYLYGRRFVLVTDHKPLLALFGPGKETPTLAANRLARWSLLLSQFDYTIEYRKTADHANADVLSRLPSGSDAQFDGEESTDDAEMVCTIEEISNKVMPADYNSLARESARDPTISKVLRFTREGWPPNKTDEGTEMQRFRQIRDQLAICNGCLVLGQRAVIPVGLRRTVLGLLHLGHFGMQRMKQLARTSVYWPNIDDDIEATCRNCVPCGEHQNKPSKPAIHPWMLPEKPWSRLHMDHAVNFLGTNWLVLYDAYSKYPCIHRTDSMTAKSTIELLEQDFAHFGYPHTLVSDNASAFLSEEFQAWCKENGITHLTGAPYHPATNGAAERLVQTFKQAMKKSNLPPKRALQEFLMQYRRTPNSTGYSPSELLNSRQIRTKIDTLLPSPAHRAQGKQAKDATKSQLSEQVAKVVRSFNVGDPVYALYFGPRRDKDPRWVPAIVTKRKGTRTFNVRVFPRGPTWRRHLEQLQPRMATPEDTEPGDLTERPAAQREVEEPAPAAVDQLDAPDTTQPDRPAEIRQPHARRQAAAPPEYDLQNPRRTKRAPKPVRRYSPSPTR